MFFKFKSMFNNMFSENCFCTLKEIQVGSHEFSRNREKLLLIVSHDLWPWNQKLLSMGFEILGLVFMKIVKK